MDARGARGAGRGVEVEPESPGTRPCRIALGRHDSVRRRRARRSCRLGREMALRGPRPVAEPPSFDAARTRRALFADDLPAWVLAPEVSFSIYGERGVIDILAWHPGRRALLVIELKTDIADVNELAGTVDRKRRLAAAIARERGWDPLTVSAWIIVAPSRTNRRRIAAHRAMLRAGFPMDGRAIRAWLRDPSEGAMAALSMWPSSHVRKLGADVAPIRRVRRARTGAAGGLRGSAAGRPRPYSQDDIP